MSQPAPPPYEGRQPYQQPTYPQQYGQQGHGYARTAPTNSTAIVALIAGIAGLTFLPLIGSIVAVIVGPMAKKQIALTGEQGDGLARAGIITGWIGMIAVLLIVFFVLVPLMFVSAASVIEG